MIHRCSTCFSLGPFTFHLLNGITIYIERTTKKKCKKATKISTSVENTLVKGIECIKRHSSPESLNPPFTNKAKFVPPSHSSHKASPSNCLFRSISTPSYICSGHICSRTSSHCLRASRDCICKIKVLNRVL